ncbi:type IIG restriction enzyme/methyltransferase [Zunongwangia sp. HGR-M22]|uniref:type IIG restriction enzyme/methyltransferase n=1 Tax=Zunongwangia sp. HGR-M22 TaxID=3015168 RepID=UPI0022DE269D|nr:TaqI-like C-terminal specificity domain-containing protein [Zunongwangia sp. HGR-M22]WBL27252.1 type II restriction endonuclease [Zunongwangia sp. HGR-M22]
MEFKILKPKKAINKAFSKIKPNRTEIESFKINLIQLLDRTNDVESEEFHKNLVIDFFKKTYYEPNHFINTKGKTDLVIHNGDKAKSNVGVLIETKKPTNKSEMLSKNKINVKAFQELVLYYLRERITNRNLDIKHLVVTNINEWYVFDEHLFERIFARNRKFVKQFQDFESGKKSTDVFYDEIAEPFIKDIEQEIDFTFFDIREYEKPLRNNNPKDDNKLISLFKLLSPEHLLKLPFANDSNSLDKRFYGELLHIIGLSETKDGSKKLIERNKKGERNTGSFLENAIIQLDSLDKINRLDNPSHFGTTQEERLFNVGLELSITWINRILFLKLLEAQLKTYHKGDKTYEFLSIDKIKNYDDLNSLFFQVLAKQQSERNQDVMELFAKVPYLNSSLFEPTGIEHRTLFISNLRDDKTIPIYSSTVLKNESGKKRTGNLNALEYLFEFLNAYDFSSEGKEEIQEDNKTLINASVLGLIFEKINGYKDGSFFTPGFITMYMCRETIRKAVIQKFNETKDWNCKDIDSLYDKIEDRQEANNIINSLKICDPAVGSGHFLVSALNEMIAVKNDLKVLQDRDGKRLKEYQFEVVNDELMITDEDGDFFQYNPNTKESQRIQEALFHEKQTIIENCLFGVDINPNSVKICRLRLWVELLKNAYYKNESELETLPNIDINIKCGNSLISRFELDADLKKALKSSKWTIDSYKIAVDTYRNAQSKEQKREMERLISDIKNDFETNIDTPFKGKLSRARGKVDKLATEINTRKQWGEKIPKKMFKDLEKATKTLKKLESQRDSIEMNKIYEDAFEWRFEFPEVLDDNGDFVGFDTIIGNPPWGASLTKEQKAFLKVRYQNIDSSTPNTFAYFIGLSLNICNYLITQILPDSILVKDFSKTRDLCSNHLYNLSWYQNTAIPDDIRPFADVEHDVCTLFLDQLEDSEKTDISTRFYQNSSVTEKRWSADKDNFILKEYDNTYNILLNSIDIGLLNKLRSLDILDDYLQCHEGIHSGNIREKLFIKEQITGKEKPMFLGGRNGDQIENYISKRFGWYVDYRKEIIDKSKNEYASLRDERIFNQPKIYLTRTGNPFKAFIDNTNYASNNFFSIQFKDYNFNSFDNLIPVLGLLNSKFANYYIRKVIAPSLGNTFVETKIIHVLKLPLAKELLESKELVALVHALINSNIKNVNDSLISQIDNIIYKIYKLTDKEIDNIEESNV